MIKFENLRKSGIMEKVLKKAEAANVDVKKEKEEKDARIYKPTLSEDKKANFVDVRLLPSRFDTNGDGVPQTVVKKGMHFFQEGTEWFVFGCWNAHEKNKCPFCSRLSDEWKSLDDKNEKSALWRHKGAKTKFYANVYIINDREFPENNGQVRVLEFGKQLKETFERSANEEDIANVWDVFSGGTLRIKLNPKNMDSKTVVPNYEASAFRSVGSALFDDVDKIEEVYNQTHDLNDVIKMSDMKPVEEVATITARVFGDTVDVFERSSSKVDEPVEETVSEKKVEPKREPKPEPEVKSSPPVEEETVDEDDDEYLDDLIDGML